MENIGWDLALDNKANWHSVLQEAIKMSNEEYYRWSTSCFEFAKRNIVNSEIINENRELFKGGK